MDTSVERTQRTYIRLLLGILFGFILFVFLCWGGYRFYSTVESRHLSRRAAAYLSGGDVRQAGLSAQRALQVNPHSIEAVRTLAEISEISGDRSALDWRRKALEFQPSSADDILALASCAVQFNEVAIAEKALAQLDATARQTAGFHAAAARLADAKKQPVEAESHWAKAVELSPSNASYRLQFGQVLLRSEDAAKRNAGHTTLEALRTDEKQRAAATRALIVDGAKRHIEGEKLIALARELQSYPEATFSDRLLYLDVLRQLHDAQFTDYLTTIEKDTVSKPIDLANLLTWMKASGISLLAIDYARTLSEETRNKWPVPLAIAEAYAKLADWAQLEGWVKDKNWGQFDFLRRAYLALALHGEDKRDAAEREWTAAEKDATSDVRHLSMLSRTVSEWGWDKRFSELLWTETKHPETRSETLQTLYQKYSDAGDTSGLYRVLLRLSELDPEDPRIQNNLAQVSLLLNADTERAGKLAEELYKKEGSNPAYASTYAFALYKKGDAQGGLRVLSKLTEDQLRDPAQAAYYGIILAAAGDTEKAREYLGIGASAKLLPEEKALVAKAQGAVR